MRCKHEKNGYRCGSYAFNLYKEGIDQGELCDVHYWQNKAMNTKLEPVHPDSARIDWLTNNPLEAVVIFGRIKGDDAVRWIRQEIDNAMLKKDGVTNEQHDLCDV